MKYDLEFRRRVEDLLIHWKPPDWVLDELERFFDEQLAVNPVSLLRVVGPDRAMECSFCTIDREKGHVHLFLFRVHYGDDENTLFVYDGFYFPIDR